MENGLSKACADYFKNTPGLRRSLEKIKEKYESLGHLGGSIQLFHLKEDEKEALSGYFQKDYYKKSAQISVMSFAKVLNNTRFEGVDFIDVLECYFGEKLQSKKERHLQYEEAKKSYFDKVLKPFEGTLANKWLKDALENKDNAYRIISQKYDENPSLLEKYLQYACEGLNQLPLDDTKIRLALYASRITKDPHTFDRNKICGKLLLYAIAYKFNCTYPENAEEQSELLYKSGLLIDELSNFTMCSGISAWKTEEIHKGWEGFMQSGEPLQISLLNLSNIEEVKCRDKKVYVFENPTVFSEVLYQTRKISPSTICTYGQLRLASLVLLDKIVQDDVKVYYSGDFDPEGIMIADKLKQRYGESLILWRYGIEEYNEIQSKVKLTEQRLKKLDNIKSPELQVIANEIKKRRYGAYQELLLEYYISDILEGI